MKYLLDSNILIVLGLDPNETLLARMGRCDEDDLVTSSIAYAEVLHASLRGKPPDQERLAMLQQAIPPLPFDERAARTYAILPFKRASYDRLIAAHALSLNLIVVTDNVADYADVPGLAVENWTV